MVSGVGVNIGVKELLMLQDNMSDIFHQFLRFRVAEQRTSAALPTNMELFPAMFSSMLWYSFLGSHKKNGLTGFFSSASIIWGTTKNYQHHLRVATWDHRLPWGQWLTYVKSPRVLPLESLMWNRNEPTYSSKNGPNLRSSISPILSPAPNPGRQGSPSPIGRPTGRRSVLAHHGTAGCPATAGSHDVETGWKWQVPLRKDGDPDFS